MHLTCRVCGEHYIIKSRGWMDRWIPRACSGDCFRTLLLWEHNLIVVDGKMIMPFVSEGTRSGFEDQFQAICNDFDIPVMHEPLKFQLSNGERYVPDYLTLPTYMGEGGNKHGPLVEVKGLWTTEGKRKFRLFEKDYPDLNVFLIDEKVLAILKRTRRKK